MLRKIRLNLGCVSGCVCVFWLCVGEEWVWLRVGYYLVRSWSKFGGHVLVVAIIGHVPYPK